MGPISNIAGGAIKFARRGRKSVDFQIKSSARTPHSSGASENSGAVAEDVATMATDLIIVVLDARDLDLHATHIHKLHTKARHPRLKADVIKLLNSFSAKSTHRHASMASEAPMSTTQEMVDTAAIQRVDPLLLKLQERGVQQVLNGTAWLSSKEVGERADPSAKNKHAMASRLLSQRRAFAIYRRGQYEFPQYQFDPMGQPIDAVSRVLDAFAGYTPFRVASWFESTSSQLGGRRPREVLEDDPSAVVEAAKAHVQGAVHG